MERSLRTHAARLALLLVAGCAPALAAPTPYRAGDENGDGRTVVACLGDSNTDPVFNARLPGGSWCERLGSSHGPTAEFVNLGAGGGTIACDFPLAVSRAGDQLDRALAAGADAVVLAFITNDVRYAVAGGCASLDPARRTKGLPITAEQIDRELSRRLHALVRRARTPHFWVLLGPPALPPEGDAINPRIEAINERLRRRYGKSRRVTVIEHPALGAEDYADALHMSTAGQRKRARAVGVELFGW
jgi:lysophospholipase L1-like esterase